PSFPRRGPSGWFPRFHGTMRCCDSLPPISPRFVSFAGRYHRCVRCSSPPAPDAEPWINLELVGGISSRLARWKRQGLPSSRRNPYDHSPYSSDPGVTRQAEWTMSELPGAAPATDHDEGSPRVVISGLNRTAFDLAVYASQGWSPTHHARLASGCWSGSTGRDWLPAGFHLKGFKLPTILLSRAFLARGQTDGLLLAVAHRLPGWFISRNSDESDLARRSLRALGREEGKVNLLDDVENCLGLEGRTVQSLLNLGGEASIEGLGLQPLDGFAVLVANAHRGDLLDLNQA